MFIGRTARRLGGAVAIAVSASMLAVAPVSAQEDPAKSYPSKPIHIIVGFAAGGGNDILARIIGQKLTEGLGQPVVIENKPGAGAIIATEYVARAPADGYTVLVGASGAMVINPAVYTKLPYDTLRDFVPVSMIASFPLFLVVNPSLPAKNVQDLIAYAKAHPDKASYGGASAAFQLATERFKMKTGTKMEFVAYKGSNESIAAVMSGELLLTIVDSPAAANMIKSGQVRALAVTSPQRSDQFPDVPTMAQAGVKDVETALFSGLFLPAATPKPIVTKLQNEIIRIVKLPDVRDRLKGLSSEPVGDTSEQFRAVIAKEIPQWTAVAKAANIKYEP
jgi:tripartite-type tricarboxylate transporter receptor subunit TctC